MKKVQRQNSNDSTVTAKISFHLWIGSVTIFYRRLESRSFSNDIRAIAILAQDFIL
jgi:hypothetical protein